MTANDSGSQRVKDHVKETLENQRTRKIVAIISLAQKYHCP